MGSRRDLHAARTRRPGRVALVVAVLAAAALTACSEPAPDDGGSGGIPGGGSSCDRPSVLACIGDDTTLGRISHKPVEASGEPIRLGMVNQETGAAGAFPELSRASQAAIDFINAELGGVDGRPLTLDVCDTQFSPAGSQACAQRMIQRDRKSTRLNFSHTDISRMPSSA